LSQRLSLRLIQDYLTRQDSQHTAPGAAGRRFEGLWLAAK
jgi:hypothetical protein